MPLSIRDAALVKDFKDFLERLLRTDERQKQRRRIRRPTRIDNAAADEVVPLPSERIPEPFVRAGARRAYRVVSDAMIGIGIREGSVIYARPSVDLDTADGEVAIVRLERTLFLKRIERHGRRAVLKSENRRYSDIHVESRDAFELVAVICR